MHVIHSSGLLSLVVQFVTFVADFYVLVIPTPPKNKAIKELLFIETLVNVVEFSFYVWLVYSFKTISNITQYRYYDWVLTTPVMLFTYSMYMLMYTKKENDEPHDLLTLAMSEKYVLAAIVLLDWCMLYFGYKSEIGEMDAKWATFLGFIPFTLMFYLIYDNYAKHTQLGVTSFVYFVTVWALYGVAALMSYKIKNTLYNILDVFAKNFFGIFLAYMVLFR